MCGAISLSRKRLPEEFISQHNLSNRITRRAEGADDEIQFSYRDPNSDYRDRHFFQTGTEK
jgi:hypothetical protein